MQKEKLLKKLVDDYWLNKWTLPGNSGQRFRSGRVKSVSARMEQAQVGNLLAMSKGNALGEFILFLSAYSILLKKYFSENNLLIASPEISIGADNAQPDNLLFFLTPDIGAVNVKALIRKMKDELQTVLNHRHYSYEELRPCFNDRNIQEDNILKFGFGYSDVNYSPDVPYAAFQLVVKKNALNEITVTIIYDEAQYDPFVVSQFAGHYLSLLGDLDQSLDCMVDDICILSDQEKRTILTQFNQPLVAGSNFASIVEMFSHQVRLNPDAIAIQASGITYTFKEIDERSEQLARHLKDKYDVCENKLVGVLATKSVWPIIGILGILKSGGAFVPIEPLQPAERIRYIVDNASIEALIMESDHMFDFNWFQGELIVSDIQIDAFSYGETELPKRNRRSLAYVMYTSGTTGKPKGVMIEDGSIINYASWLIETFKITPMDSSLLLASLAFDLGYTSVWGTLLSGGTLHLLDVNYGNAPDQLLLYLKANKINFIKTTPSLFYMLTHVPEFKTVGKDLVLRLILLGGEPIKEEDVVKYREWHPATVFVNHYGPTESTIGCVVNILYDEISDRYTRAPVIGKPIANTEAFILGDRGELLPIGVEGELCISGSGLARGYFNDSQISASKFIPHPFRIGERLYKTGDYARWNEHGLIILYGRKDDQIKIRGYRVELREIEHVLREHSDIEEAVVTVQTMTDGEKRIIAYFKSTKPVDVLALRNFMTEFLPAHMIPGQMLRIDHIPLTSNGKIDSRRLRAPSLLAGDTEQYVSPRNEIEKVIAKAWEEVLSKERISISDNFFDLGGNSLYLIKVSSILAAPFPSLGIVDLFNYTTIEKLSYFIAENRVKAPVQIPWAGVVLPEEYFELSGETGLIPEVTVDLRFKIMDELLHELNDIATSEKIDIQSILASIFAYALHETSLTDEITFQSLRHDGSKIVLQSMFIDFKKIGNPSALFQTVFCGSGLTGSIDVDTVEGISFSNQGGNVIVPVIYKRGAWPNHMLSRDMFDILVEVDDEDQTCINCILEYNRKRLSNAAMDKFVNLYINILSGLIKVEG